MLLRVAFLSHLEQLTVRKGYLIAAWLGACFFLEEEPKRQTGRKERRTPKQHVAVVARLTSICRNKPNLSYSGEAVELSDPHPHTFSERVLLACLRVVYINNLSCSFPRFKRYAALTEYLLLLLLLHMLDLSAGIFLASFTPYHATWVCLVIRHV